MKTKKPVVPESVSNNSVNSPAESINKNTAEDGASETHNFVLSRREAQAASPEDMAVCGEEDPGEALEFLVTDKESQTQPLP